MVAGSRLTNVGYTKTTERVATKLVTSGFTLRQTVVCLSTVYNYTISFVMEEQVVFPEPGKRSPLYDVAQRNAKLSSKELPLLRRSGLILFDGFERRYNEGLALIVSGAQVKRVKK